MSDTRDGRVISLLTHLFSSFQLDRESPIKREIMIALFQEV